MKKPVALLSTPVSKSLPVIRNRYDAAGTGPRIASWHAPSSGPLNATAAGGTQRLVDRSRDAGRNEPTGANALGKLTTAIIGTGIVPRLPREASDADRRRYGEMWDQFVAECDADGIGDHYGQQTLVTRTWAEAGECFARIRWRRPESGLAFPMQIQILEREYVPLELSTETYPGLPTGHVITQGIETNRVGMRTAVWFYKAHPFDLNVRGVPSADQLVRVPISEVIHVFERKRPGQMRGVPEFAPALARQRIIGDLDETVLERQRLANLFVGFIKRTRPDYAEATVQLDPVTNEPIGIIDQATGTPLIPLSPGLIQELGEGEEIEFPNVPEAGSTYSEYARTQYQMVAAGQGVPYELVTGDIKEVSDRTLRILINEFRRHCEVRQWQMLIPMFCRPVRAAWVKAGVLAGKIPASKAAMLTHALWQPHGWPPIHPVQDVQGKRMEVDAGFRSRSSVIAERGDDPFETDEERRTDLEREKSYGLYTEEPGQQPSTGGPPVGDIDPDEYDNDPTPPAR